MSTRECNHTSAMATPSYGEAGKTGQWRTQRPVFDPSKCIPVKNNAPGCFQCWLYCPEAVITRGIPIEIDLTYCKGCGICAAECASGAITMAPEASPEHQAPA
jgi:2-oxoacid:acceptor oxidoreductase delta subunit (pyruvate/2-ketoisovalerate family)